MRENFSDPLFAMWREQAEHWAREWERYGKPSDVNALHLRLCHHLHGEVDELLRCADWKIHAKGETASTRKIVFECVDLWKFLLTMMILHGVSPAQFVTVFHEKSRVVRGRVMLEVLRDRESCPVFVCDIDGVLCDRDTELRRFYNHDYQERHEQGMKTIRGIKVRHGQAEYERLKSAFYEHGGFERCEPIRTSVARLGLLPNAMPILLVTSRDIERYPRLEYETYEWLHKHEVPYDALMFASEKERAVAWIDRTSVAIDDEREHTDKLSLVCKAIRYEGPESMSEAVRLAARSWEEHDA